MIDKEKTPNRQQQVNDSKRRGNELICWWGLSRAKFSGDKGDVGSQLSIPHSQDP